jgi:hypothetical protein
VSRSHEAAGKSVGEHEDNEGNSIWGGREEVLTGDGLSMEVGFCRRGTATVARCGGRAADFGPGKHQEDDAVLKEVAAGLEKRQRWLSTLRCPWKKRRMGNWQWRHGPSVVGGG